MADAAASCPSNPTTEGPQARHNLFEKIAGRSKSVEAQQAAARTFCEARGYVIVQEFSDSGIFGAEFANRPGLNALLDAATAKKRDFTGLVIRDVDRLGRDQFPHGDGAARPSRARRQSVLLRRQRRRGNQTRLVR